MSSSWLSKGAPLLVVGSLLFSNQAFGLDSVIRGANLALPTGRADYFLANAGRFGYPVLLCEVGNSIGSEPIINEEDILSLKPKARLRFRNKLRRVCTQHRDTRYRPLANSLQTVVLPVTREGATPVSLVFSVTDSGQGSLSPSITILLKEPRYGKVTIVGDRINYATDGRYRGEESDSFSVLYVGTQGALEIAYTIAKKG